MDCSLRHTAYRRLKRRSLRSGSNSSRFVTLWDAKSISQKGKKRKQLWLPGAVRKSSIGGCGICRYRGDSGFEWDDGNHRRISYREHEDSNWTARGRLETRHRAPAIKIMNSHVSSNAYIMLTMIFSRSLRSFEATGAADTVTGQSVSNSRRKRVEYCEKRPAAYKQESREELELHLGRG